MLILCVENGKTMTSWNIYIYIDFRTKSLVFYHKITIYIALYHNSSVVNFEWVFISFVELLNMMLVMIEYIYSQTNSMGDIHMKQKAHTKQ